MRINIAAFVLVVAFSSGRASAFAPAAHGRSSSSCLFSTLEERSSSSSTEASIQFQIENELLKDCDDLVPLTAQEINTRLQSQLEKLQLKDKSSRQLNKEDLQIVYEDKHMIVVDKPTGVLTVAGKDPNNPNLAQTVFNAINDKNEKDGKQNIELPSADHMVVHRLGMDTSGLIVLAKNKAAVRGMNELFRSRSVERQYEALVAGHIQKDEGLISLPIMRDYEFPPYVRISTDDHQRALLGLEVEEVGKKLLEGPKESITKYEVVSREEYNGQHPVTRVLLTSISGRYHQLNVHMAAFGHPIIGDKVYGYNGEAVSNGGLTDAELEQMAPNPNRASAELQAAISDAGAKELPPCVHAKHIKFRHPLTKKAVEFSTDSPF